MTVAFGGLVFAVSFATLVFDGPEAPAGALAAGASFVLFGGAATAAVVAARSSLPAIAEVQDGPSAIFAVMAAAIYGTEGIDETAKLPTLEAAIICTTVSTGAIMSLLGKYKLGNIVRLLPSPVTGGFLAGTGYVLTAGALKVLSGSSDAVGLDTFVTFVRTMIANVHDTGSIVSVIDPSSGWIERGVFVFAPGVALGLALAVGNRRVRKFWVVPAFLGGGVAAYFSALRVFLNLSPDDALTRGYLLGPFPNLDGPQRRFGFFLDSERFGFAADAIVGDAANANDANAGVFGTSFDPLLRHPDVFIDRVRWDVVLDQAPGAVAVIGLSVLGVLLITSAVEMSTERDGDANDELSAAGAANVVSGLGGGFVGYHSLSSTQIAHGMGAPASRVPGITCALAYVGALFVGPAPLAYVPKALIGGLLLFIGSSFLYEWVVEGKDRLPRSEYAVVLLIVVTVASQGYIAGVAAGVLGAAAVFVSDYSKVPVVRSRLRLGQAGGVRSSAPRARSEVEVINRRGAATYGAKLQGFLFFATAYKVLEEIKEAYDTPPGLSHVVLDFSAVVGVDGSAIAVFEKLERWARRERVVLVLSDCARPALERVLDIALAGEAQPTFAFVDRPSSFTEKDEKRPLAPGLSLLRDAVGDGLVASDAFGIVVQTTDLDAALRFTEQSLLFAEAEEVSAKSGGGGADDPQKAVVGLTGNDSGRTIDVSSEVTEVTDGSSDETYETFETFETFDAVCASVCETNDLSTRSQKAFRAAWTPVAFDADAVVCERGEVADRIYWIESAVVVVETGGRVTEETEETFFEERGTNERTSSAVDDAYDDETENEHSSSPSSDFGSEKKTRVVSPTDSEGSFATPGEADAPSDARRSERRETPTETPTDPRVDPSSLPSASATSEKAAAEMAYAERASYGVSVTRDFMGAVGFYRRGGVGRVRFGRIVVREPGDGYCLSAEALEALERSHPRLAVRLHKLLAGTLANQVVSRNKLITQFIK